MSYNAWFQCINGCPGQFSLREVIYRCPSCGDLLEVQHDFDALRSRSGAAWMQLFDDRYRRNTYPYGSGVWGKKEWVVPFIDNENIVSTYEGNSNLLWADRYGKQLHVEDLWIKQCGNSHTGSFKDLGMTVLVSVVKQMMADGVPIDAVACASTGDTSAALGAYSVVQEITEERRIYLANSMNSLRIEGQKTVAIEIVQQFDWEVPDWVVIPGGNLGNVHAVGQGFLMMHELGLVQRLPRICVAQAERANPLYRSFQDGFKRFEPITAQPTLATAIQIGNPVSVKRAIRTLQRFNGVVEQASEQELADEAARADRTGMFNCPHTGVALAALRKLVDRKVIRSHERVVVVSTAHGLKFADQKAAYHLGALDGIRPAHRNQPVELPPEPRQVARAIARHVERARLLVS